MGHTNTRGLIFDLDDTLYPRERFVRSGFAAVAQYVEQQFGVPASHALTTLLKASGPQHRVEFQALCEAFHLPETIVPQLLVVFRAHRPALWLFHDAEATLCALRASGWRLAILTNGLPQVQASKIEALGVAAFVDHVVYAEDHAEGGKPHAAPFREVLKRLELPADRCVMVGDDVDRDIRGAHAAGLGAIRILRHDSLLPSDADATVGLLAEVPAAAESLLQRLTVHAA